MKKLIFLILLSIILGCTKEESARLNHQMLDLKPGNTGQLIMILPSNAEYGSVTWESSDPAIVTIDNRYGVYSAKQAGEATITATTDDGKFTAQCHVTVTDDLCIPCYVEKGICAEDGYKFPDIPEMNDWQRPGIIKERIAALQIPDACLEILYTKGLLETCLEFPYNIDMLLSDNYQRGFNSLVANFNGFRELFERPDLVSVLLNKYNELAEYVKSVYLLESVERGMLSLRMFIFEFILAQDVVLENLNTEQERELFLLSLEHRKIKSDYPDIFGGWHYVSRALLYAKKIMLDNAAGDYADELWEFINGRSLPMDFYIDQNTVKYLDDYINNKFK